MKRYHMELPKYDADLIIAAVNQGIDSYLQAVNNKETEFVWDERGYGNRLICDVAPNDFGVIVRRLLETEGEAEESLARDMCSTMGIDGIWLCTEDRFYITIIEDDEFFDDWEHVAAALDLPYISVFDKAFWPYLFNEVL